MKYCATEKAVPFMEGIRQMRSLIVASVLVGCWASSSKADDENAQKPIMQTQSAAYPNDGEGAGSEKGIQIVEDTRHERSYQIGLHLLVPIFPGKVSINVPEAYDRNASSSRVDIAPQSVTPGLGFDARFGLELTQRWILEAHIGLIGNKVDDAGSGSTSLTNLWLAAMARHAFINATAFVPFVSAGFAGNLWAISFPGADSGLSESGKFTFSLNATAGAVYELSRSWGVELGLQANLSLKGDLFAKPFAWITPVAGAAFYF